MKESPKFEEYDAYELNINTPISEERKQYLIQMHEEYVKNKENKHE